MLSPIPSLRELRPYVLADAGEHGIKLTLVDQRFNNRKIAGNVIQTIALNGELTLAKFQSHLPVFDLKVDLPVLVHPEPGTEGFLTAFVGFDQRLLATNRFQQAGSPLDNRIDGFGFGHRNESQGLFDRTSHESFSLKMTRSHSLGNEIQTTDGIDLTGSVV